MQNKQINLSHLRGTKMTITKEFNSAIAYYDTFSAFVYLSYTCAIQLQAHHYGVNFHQVHEEL